MLKVIAVLLALWLAFIVIGALVKALFWLLAVGIVLFLATALYGWAKRHSADL